MSKETLSKANLESLGAPSRSNKSAEVGAMRKMIDRAQKRFGLNPEWVAANTANGASAKLDWLALKR